MKNIALVLGAAVSGAVLATAVPYIATAQAVPDQFPWEFTRADETELSSSGWLLNRKVGALWYCATQGPMNETPPMCFPVAMKTFNRAPVSQ